MRDRDRANKKEIAIPVFSVATKDLSHDVLLMVSAPINAFLGDQSSLPARPPIH